MRETRSSGSVRGASGDGRPYRERNPRRCRAFQRSFLSEPTTDAQPGQWELLFMPQSCLATAGA